MIPLRDNIPSRHRPVVNYLILAVCLAVFLAQQFSSDGGTGIVDRFGMIPARISDPDLVVVVQQPVVVPTDRGPRIDRVERKVAPAAIPTWATIVTCTFLHAGWMHFLGNMWFLYVFGDNVEDRFGHFGFALVYLGTGTAASMAHYFTDTSSVVPTIGASGAVAGVMGAYAVLYPQARVQAVLPLLIVMPVFILPAPLFLGIWFTLQTLQGLSAISGGAAGGVAWWAHIGGFVAGALVAYVGGKAHLENEEVTERRF